MKVWEGHVLLSCHKQVNVPRDVIILNSHTIVPSSYALRPWFFEYAASPPVLPRWQCTYGQCPIKSWTNDVIWNMLSQTLWAKRGLAIGLADVMNPLFFFLWRGCHNHEAFLRRGNLRNANKSLIRTPTAMKVLSWNRILDVVHHNSLHNRLMLWLKLQTFLIHLNCVTGYHLH